jgi:hypothetical protein
VTVKRRLMALDYCLSVKGTGWLLTEREKTAFFLAHGVTGSDMPSEQFGGAKRYFVEKQPISTAEDGTPTFAFIDEGTKGLSHWELFVRQHRTLFQRLEQVSVVYAGTQPDKFIPAERIYRRLISGSTDSGSFDLVRLKRYFESRKLFEARDYSSFDQLRLDQFREDRKVFVGEPLETLYARWMSLGEGALAPIARRGIVFATQLLKHRYEWISPIYGEERRECDALDSIAG